MHYRCANAAVPNCAAKVQLFFYICKFLHDFLVDFYHLAFYAARDLVFPQGVYSLCLNGSNALRGESFDGYLHLTTTYYACVAVHVLFQDIDMPVFPLEEGIEIKVSIELEKAKKI